jgi:hypothetical protein
LLHAGATRATTRTTAGNARRGDMVAMVTHARTAPWRRGVVA